MTTTNWFAVQTRPRAELTALADITALGLEAYVPQETRIRRTRKGKEVVQHPLMPGFIFVLCAKSREIADALKSHAVRDVLRNPDGEPHPIRPKIVDGSSWHFVDEMRAREQAGDFDFTPRQKAPKNPDKRFAKGGLKELMAFARAELFPEREPAALLA